MNVIDRINKAKRSITRAENEYNSGNFRQALGSLSYAQDYLTAGYWLLHAEIEEEDKQNNNEN